MSTRRSLAAPQRCGRRSAEAQGGVRTIAIQRSQLRPKGGAAVAGPGCSGKTDAATGSYEGSLAIEGIPDSHEPSCFTVRWSRQSWRLPHRPVHGQPAFRRKASSRPRVPRARTKVCERGRQEEEATGMSEARSSEHREPNTLTPRPGVTRFSGAFFSTAVKTVRVSGSVRQSGLRTS